MPLAADDFADLYDRHARTLALFFQRRTYDPEAAVDLMAETFAAAFRDRGSFRGDGDDATAAWLYGIARHQLSAYYRRGAVERRGLARLGVDRRALTDAELERIEQLAGTAELRDDVARALAELSAEHREALERRAVPGRFDLVVNCHPDVESVTIRSPRDIRTLVPSRRGLVILAVYDGDFPAGEIVLTAHMRGGKNVVDRIPLGTI